MKNSSPKLNLGSPSTIWEKQEDYNSNTNTEPFLHRLFPNLDPQSHNHALNLKTRIPEHPILQIHPTMPGHDYLPPKLQWNQYCLQQHTSTENHAVSSVSTTHPNPKQIIARQPRQLHVPSHREQPWHFPRRKTLHKHHKRCIFPPNLLSAFGKGSLLSSQLHLPSSHFSNKNFRKRLQSNNFQHPKPSRLPVHPLFVHSGERRTIPNRLTKRPFSRDRISTLWFDR